MLGDQVFQVDYQEDCILHHKAQKRVWHACGDHECTSCLLNHLVENFSHAIDTGSIATSCLDSHVENIMHKHNNLSVLGQISSFIHADTYSCVVLFPHQSKEIATDIDGMSFVSAWEFKRHARCRINSSEGRNESTDQSLVEKCGIDVPLVSHWKLSRVHTRPSLYLSCTCHITNWVWTKK